MTWNPRELNEDIGLTLADRYIGDRHGTRGVRQVEEYAFAVLDKLRSLPPGMAEPFANALPKSFFHTMKKSLPTASSCL
jgi:hypothetical protein